MAENDVGNVSAMRKALEQASYFLHRHHMGAVYAPDGETLIYCWDVAKIVDDALTAPARNCDIGTAKEQAERFKAFCLPRVLKCSENSTCPAKHPCNEIGIQYCQLKWAQLPYEKGDGKC